MDRETGRRLRRVCLVSAGLAAALGLLLLLRPPCWILRATGLYCAGCGGSRMLAELLRGETAHAFRQNPFLFAALPAAAVYLAAEAVRYVAGKRPFWERKWAQAFLVLLLIAAVGFTVLRNLPGFECLRPQ